MAEENITGRWLRPARKPWWIGVVLVLAAGVAAVGVGAWWQPQPVAVEKELPLERFGR